MRDKHKYRNTRIIITITPGTDKPFDKAKQFILSIVINNYVILSIVVVTKVIIYCVFLATVI